MAAEQTHGSIGFDRAADFYDATRALSPEAAARVNDLLVAELMPLQSCLEIGVGTGRIALPLAQAGLRVVGVDVSRPMLTKLLEKAGGVEVQIAVADATRLPFSDASFGAAIVCHVLHLIPDWQKALAELARAVRRNGVVLIELGWRGNDERREVGRYFLEHAGAPTRSRGLDDASDLELAMSRLGARRRDLQPIPENKRTSLDDVIDGYESALFAPTWSLPRTALVRAGRETRRWAAKRFGGLDEPREFEERITWVAFDMP